MKEYYISDKVSFLESKRPHINELPREARDKITRMSLKLESIIRKIASNARAEMHEEILKILEDELS